MDNKKTIEELANARIAEEKNLQKESSLTSAAEKNENENENKNLDNKKEKNTKKAEETNYNSKNNNKKQSEEKKQSAINKASCSFDGKERTLTHEQVFEFLNMNELGDGLIYAHLFKNKHVYIGQSAQWMLWKEHHWTMDLIDSAHFALSDVEYVTEVYQQSLFYALACLENAKKEGTKEEYDKWEQKVNALNKRISKLRSVSGRKNCVEFAKTNKSNSLAIEGNEIDRDPWSLPVANGVINLQTGELQQGNPEDYLLKASPIEWKGIDEPCPNWEKFILEIMEDNQEMADFLRRAFGYGISGKVSEQKFIILYGKGRNGKGVLTDIIQEIMGGEDSHSCLVGPIQSEMLLDQGKNKSSSGPSPDIMTLHGLRIALASETDEGQRFSAARVKWFSGADMLTGRYPHDKRNIKFAPTHFLCLLTNSKPNAPSQDFAFWERLLLVDFPLSFVDREPQTAHERPVDKKLKEKLQKERSGILAWLVRGCLEWQQIGLDPPQKVREAVADYRKNEDILGDFLDDYCEVELSEPEKIRIKATDIYEAFMHWYKKNVHSKREFSQKAFGKIMGDRFERDKRGGIYYYNGISIKQEIQEVIDNEQAQQML